MLIDHHSALELRAFQAVNQGAGPLLDRTMQLLSLHAFGIAFAALLSFLIVAALRRAALRPIGALAVAVFTSDFVGSHLVRPFFGRMRPCYALAPGTFRWLAPAANGPSFPSLHASNMFALALVVSLARPRLAPVAYLAALAVSLSRIYVGVHWPSDVVAGAMWGTLAGATGWVVATWVARRAAAGPAAGLGEHGR